MDETYGYNIKLGGNNKSHSEETKKKIGQANKISQKGKKWTVSQKELISNKFSGENNPFYGKHHTEETKKKISESRTGKCAGSNHPFFGKHHSQNSLQKMSKNR
jgi:hypothetical protein